MKALLNQQPLCESTLKSSALRFSLFSPGLSPPVKRRLLPKTRPQMHHLVRAAREVLAGLDALILSLDAQINKRIFIGVGLMGVVAPLAACVYMLFDWRVDKVPGWYHDNYFHFFLLLAPYLFVLTCLIGAWFLFPVGSKRAYALTVPAGYVIGKILWLASVNNDTEFYAVVPLSFIGIGVLISTFLFVALDWLAHNKFHREDAFEARLSKLIELADDFPDDKFKSMVKTVYREKKAFQKSY